jgi:hypothetical protein
LQRNRDGRLKARLSTRSDEVGVKKDPRRSSECSSGLSSERVSFAKKQRQSSEGLSQYSSEQGRCEEGPEKVVQSFVWFVIRMCEFCKETETVV